MLEEDFPTFPGDRTEDCRLIIEEVSDQSCDEVVKSKKLWKMKKCVVAYLKKHKYPEYVMKNAVIMASPSSSYEEKAEKSKEIKRENNRNVEKSVEFCAMHNSFSDIFDHSMNSPQDTSDGDPVQKYCMRKHVVDSHEIDTSVYPVNVNPENIDTEKAKDFCVGFYSLYKYLVKMAIESVIDKYVHSETARKCVRGKVFQTQFIDEILMLEVLSELKLTDAQKAAEKKKFMDSNDRIMESVLDCVI